MTYSGVGPRGARGAAFDATSCHSPRVVALLKQAYSAASLPTHPKKSFFMDEVAHFWGADVFGGLGLVQPSWTRLIPLVFITLAAASLPALSISLLKTLAGSWISVLTFRRRTLCLLQEVYRLQHACSSSGLVGTTCALRRELFTLCALAPLLRTDMRASTSGYLVASDASDDLGAFLSAQVSYPLARELRRHTPVKGLWSKLLSPSEALLRSHRQLPADRELPGESYRSHPLWTQLARALRFKKVAVFRRRHAEHINIKELESYLAAEEALCTSVWESSRTISLLDSQVCVGALLKGRSSSFSLNCRLCASVRACFSSTFTRALRILLLRTMLPMTPRGNALFGLLLYPNLSGFASLRAATFPSSTVFCRSGNLTPCSSRAFPSSLLGSTPDRAGLPFHPGLCKQLPAHLPQHLVLPRLVRLPLLARPRACLLAPLLPAQAPPLRPCSAVRLLPLLLAFCTSAPCGSFSGLLDFGLALRSASLHLGTPVSMLAIVV